MAELRGKTFNIKLIQIYAPTNESEEEYMNTFYKEITKVKEQCKEEEVTLITGDLNAKVGEGIFEDIIGQYGIGNRNGLNGLQKRDKSS